MATWSRNKVFQDFDLQFDWKISKAGNSGLFINVLERPDLGTTFSTGEEYQLLDDRNVPSEYVGNLSHKAASIFGVVPNTSNSVPKSGEWNHSRILQQNGAVTFWLNDVLTVQVDLKSDLWKHLVATSSLGKYPEFGIALNGHLALQGLDKWRGIQEYKAQGPRARSRIPGQSIGFSQKPGGCG